GSQARHRRRHAFGRSTGNGGRDQPPTAGQPRAGRSLPRSHAQGHRPIGGSPMPGPLSGIRVLDFTWALAGPYGVMVLADLGAEVWKIETAQQNERRRGNGPYVHGVSTYFFSVNRGKKSIMLDLKAPDAKEIVYKLVKEVDVLTENFSPGTMADLGFDYETMSRINPRLVYASTSGFGQRS